MFIKSVWSYDGKKVKTMNENYVSKEMSFCITKGYCLSYSIVLTSFSHYLSE